MTEQGWLASEDPAAMLGWLRIMPGLPVGTPSDRKLRLFACAAVRLFWGRLTAGMRQVVEVAERMADGLAGDEDFYAASQEEHEGEDRSGDSKLRVLIHKCAINLSWDGPFVANGTVEYALYLDQSLGASLAALLRDVVGDPFDDRFRRLTPGSTAADVARWLTPTVLSLVQAAYDDRPLPDGTLDPDRLLMLSDALEEAGCADQGLLGHLRGRERCPRCGGTGTVTTDLRDWAGPTRWCDDMQGALPGPACDDTGWIPLRGPHVRGCWAVDLLLGKG
jgi:hypothetical protein